MLTNEEIEQRFKPFDHVFYVKVEGDGYKYQLTLVSDFFVNKRKVARQQWVYAQINDYISSGALHALSMKTLTKEEWEREHG